jgi:RHS repeat-associated protein
MSSGKCLLSKRRLSTISRFALKVLLSLSLLLTGTVTGSLVSFDATASTWIPIRNSNITIFIPKPGLKAVIADTFVYSNDTTLTLDGFGVTTAIYYQTQQWTSDSYAAPSAWQCHDKATLTANNNTLQLSALANGRYQVNVVAAMAKQTCDLSTFIPDTSLTSIVYTSNEFMVIGASTLTSATASLSQDTSKTSYNTLASYDMHMTWPALEGSDAYQLSLIKDNISYNQIDGLTNPIPAALLTTTSYTVNDKFYPATTIESGTLSEYTGPGQYSFSIGYCFNNQCSVPMVYDQQITVLPLQPTYYAVDDHRIISRLNANQIQVWFQADKRTTQFVIAEQYLSGGTVSQSSYLTQLEEILPNHNTRGTGYVGAPNYSDNGQTLNYTHVMTRPNAGYFRYYISGCISDCVASYTPYVSQNAEIINNSALPYGQLDTYVIGKPGSAHLTGWAFDDNIPDNSGTKTDIRLMINGYSIGGQTANLFNKSVGTDHGFDIDLEAVINNNNLIDTNDILNLQLWAYDYAGGAANDGYVLIDSFTINKLYKDKPQATNDAITLKKGEDQVLNVTFNDIDLDESNQLITPVNLTTANHGTVTVQANNTILYQPNSTSTPPLTDSFSYQAQDRLGQISDNSALVTLSFADFVANNDIAFIDWEALATPSTAAAKNTSSLVTSLSSVAVTLDVLYNDDNATYATVIIKSQGRHGKVTTNSENKIIYALKDVAPSLDCFEYYLTRDVGVQTDNSNTASVCLYTGAKPKSDHLAAKPDAVTPLDVLANDFQGTLINGKALVPVITKKPRHGTYNIGSVSGNNRLQVMYRPHDGYTGTDSFTYQLFSEYNGQQQYSSETTATIEVGHTPAQLNNMTVSAPNGDTNIQINWTANGSDSYQLQSHYSTVAKSASQVIDHYWSTIVLSSSIATSHTVASDKNGFYYYRARACKQNVICSNWSYGEAQINGHLDTPISSIPDAPIIRLTRPQSDDVVGQLPGSGGISGGSASYNIPIQVPPGRQGMQPELSFNYNSGGGNGLLGKGWSMSGQAAVSRCSANWTEDGKVDRVNLADDDLLCLNGQKLVLVSGSYGESDSAYRTQQDSFNKISLKGTAYSSASAYFEVISKSGQISYYGNSDNNDQGAGSVLIPAGSTVPLSWAISKVHDNAVTKNNMLFTYTNTAGERYLNDIYYTGQDDAQGDRRVQLSYEPRDDVSFGYIAGGTTKSTVRLAAVTTWVGDSKVFNYALTYLPGNSLATGHALLRSVQQCGFESANAHCLPSKVFEYTGRAINFTVIESDNGVFNSALPWNIANQMLSDFNNDGILDFARYDTVHLMRFDNSKYVIEKNLKLPFISYGAVEDLAEVVKLGQLDFDNDGQLDFIGVSKNSKLSIAQLNDAQTGFTEQELNIDMLCYVIRKTSETYNGEMTSSLDFKPPNTCRAEAISDGTGGHYLFHRSAGQDLYLSRLHPSCDGNVCGTPQLVAGLDKVRKTVSKYHESPPNYQFFDFDGDGDPDISRLEEVNEDPNSPIQLVWFRNDQTGEGANATNNFEKITIPLPTLTKRFAMGGGGNHWIDANGDGLQDLLINSGHWYLLMNQGGTLSAPVDTGINHFDRSNICVMNCLFSGPQHTTHPSIRIVDFNNDGLQDFMFLDRAIKPRANGDNRPDQRDCYSDRLRSHCKEGSGGESPSTQDFSISPLAFGQYSVYLSNLSSSGAVSFTLKETDIVGSMNNFYPLDLNSDGNMDFIGAIRQYDQTTIYRDASDPYPSLPTQAFLQLGHSDITHRQPDLLTVAADNYIGDSFDQQDTFDYQPFSRHKKAHTGSAAVDNSDLAGKYYYRIPSTQTVAIQHDQKNALGTNNTQQYIYGDAIYHQAGLGFLGFESITQIDVRQGTTSVSEFLQDYPLNGKIERTTVTETADESVLHTQTFNWCNATAAGCNSKETGVYFTRLIDTATNTFDPDGNALKSATTTYSSYDDYGNVTRQTSVVSDISTEHTTVVDTVYQPADEANWWVNKLDYSEITKSVNYTTDHGIAPGTNGNKTQRRTVTYKPGNVRQPATEILSGSDTNIQSLTTYNTYDTYGNPTKVTRSGIADSAVSYTDVQAQSVTEYDYTVSSGYFINTEKNGLWLDNTVTRTWDAHFGIVATETNINGISLTNQLDPLGRLIQVDSSIAPARDIIYSWGVDGNSHGVFETTTVQDGAPTVVESFDRNSQVLKRTVKAFTGNTSAEQDPIELFNYDELGRLIEQTEPHFIGGEQSVTNYSDFDVLNRYGTKTVDSAPQNYTVTYGFTGLSSTITVTSVSSGILSMSRSYNVLDQLLSTTDTNSKSTYYHYDANGSAILIKDVSGNLITAKYDGLGQKHWFDDPNLGLWQFRYNGLGQLRWQQDANGNQNRFDYDQLGRQTKRYLNNQLDASWVFDTRIKGALSSETRDELTKNTFYDTQARVIKETTAITHNQITKSFDMEYAYDSYYGRLKGIRYPTGELLAYQYDQFGYNTIDVNPNESNAVYHRINSLNQHGKITSRLFGNGLYSTTQYTSSGDMARECVNRVTGCSGSASLDEIHYQRYDNFGNLKAKKDLVNNIEETYYYDSLHRITSTTRTASGVVVPTFTPAATINYDYDDSGNLLKKEDYATDYTYTGGTTGGPNAVKSITKLNGNTVNFTYDNNGNLKAGDGITLEYNNLNKPTQIIRNGVTLAFEYGADEQRYKQTATHADKTVTTFYVGKVFEQIDTTKAGTTTTEKRHYLSDYAVLTHKPGVGKTLSYLHHDRLGSTTLITTGDKHLNNVGSFFELVLERRGYDVFGKARDLYWGDGLLGKLSSNISNRGFTDHEHLDDVELIHMNGRGYDYNLGRFLSVDPFIQMPSNSQSINPYSYIMNNPLAGTDPSGYKSEEVGEGSRRHGISDHWQSTSSVKVTGNDSGGDKAKDISLGDIDISTIEKIDFYEGTDGVYFVITLKDKVAATVNNLSSGDIWQHSGGSGGANQPDQQNLLGDIDFGPGPIQGWIFDNVINPIPDIKEAANAFMDGDFSGTVQSMFGIVGKKVKAVGKLGEGIADGVTKITGYTKHGLNQALGRDGGRGVKATEMLEAIRNPKKVIQQANRAVAYRGKKATVVLNREGKVITTFGKSRGPQIWKQGTSTSVRPSGSGSAQSKANEIGFSYLPKSIR